MTVWVKSCPGPGSIFLLISLHLLTGSSSQEKIEVRSISSSSRTTRDLSSPPENQNGNDTFDPFGYVVDSVPCGPSSRSQQQCVKGCGVRTMCREYFYTKSKTETLAVCKCDDENKSNWNLGKAQNCGFVNWTRVITEDFGMENEESRHTTCSTPQELAYQKCGLQCEVMKDDPHGPEGLYHGFLCLGESSLSNQNSRDNNNTYNNYTCECLRKVLDKITEPEMDTYGLQDACPYSRHWINIGGGSSSNGGGGGHVQPADTVTFHLYTNPRTPNHYDILQLNDLGLLYRSRYNKAQPLKILIHGYRGGPFSKFPQNVKNAYLRKNGGNILVVGWQDLAKLNQAYFIGSYYRASVINAPIVGRRVAEFIYFMIKNQYVHLGQVHLIGHSLGAHVGGIVGNLLMEWRPRAAVKRITGLDPAGPHFYTRLGMGRPLIPGDAQTVDIIHTDQYLWGRAGQIGTADFIPNGGTLVQQNCRENISNILLDIFTLGTCSHSAAHILFSNSIGRWDIRACRCSSLILFLQGRCKCTKGSQDEAIFGENCSPAARGNFFLDVKPCMENVATICSSWM